MTPEHWAILITSVLSGGAGIAFKSWLERDAIHAKSDLDDATATATILAAARELVDPLREQLVEDRAAHSNEVAEIRAELLAALAEARQLRGELAKARVEADALRCERETYRERIRDLERGGDQP